MGGMTMSGSTGANGVAVSREGAVQIIRFVRPEKKNAINAAMYAAMTEALEAASRDDAIAVSVFLGAPEIFCAGNDIADFIRAASEGREIEGVAGFLKALATAGRPLMAGVDGLAVGIGTTMLMHCDHVLATPRAVFRTPFTALGLLPEAASSLIGPRLMGHRRAFELLVMGRDMDAEAARAAGLVNHVVAPEALEDAVLAAARHLAGLPREAMLASRRLLKGDSGEILTRIEEEIALFAERLKSPEAQAAFQTFMQKGKS
jgi:enoyl-CoA hydratase/carnithine racemase